MGLRIDFSSISFKLRLIDTQHCVVFACLISRRALPSQHIAKITLNEVIGKNQTEKPQ
jgi:hypothetical protein